MSSPPQAGSGGCVTQFSMQHSPQARPQGAGFLWRQGRPGVLEK